MYSVRAIAFLPLKVFYCKRNYTILNDQELDIHKDKFWFESSKLQWNYTPHNGKKDSKAPTLTCFSITGVALIAFTLIAALTVNTLSIEVAIMAV